MLSAIKRACWLITQLRGSYNVKDIFNELQFINKFFNSCLAIFLIECKQIFRKSVHIEKLYFDFDFVRLVFIYKLKIFLLNWDLEKLVSSSSFSTK